jgi:hypothetical protein
MKHFASFISPLSQADNNSFLNRLKVPLAGIGAGVGLLGSLALSRKLGR